MVVLPSAEVSDVMGRPRKIQPAQRLQPLVDEFVSVKRAGGRSPATIAIFEWWLGDLARQIPDTASIDVLSLTRFFTAARERGLAPSSVHQGYRTVKTFLGYLEKTRRIPSNFIEDVDAPKVPDPLIAIPTTEEIKRVIRECGGGVRGARNRAMVLVTLDAALRSGELRRLTVEDWNPADRTLKVFGKGAKGRVVKVDKTAARALREYLAMRGPVGGEQFLFVGRNGKPLGSRHWVGTVHYLSDRAGIPQERRLHPHLLRHAGATAWCREDMNPAMVQRLLGHSSAHTTWRYLHLSGRDTAKAHEQAGAVEKMGISW